MNGVRSADVSENCDVLERWRSKYLDRSFFDESSMRSKMQLTCGLYYGSSWSGQRLPGIRLAALEGGDAKIAFAHHMIQRASDRQNL